MQGKILIVDAIATNRIVLKVKLASAFYHVLQADSLDQATKMASLDAPDLIVCALDMPDGEGAARLCEVIQDDPVARYIPVLGIGAALTPADRMAALQAGVDDIVERPIDVTLLLGRVRSLIRACNTSAEWRMHEDTSAAFGLAEPRSEFEQAAHFMLVSPDGAGRVQQWRTLLRPTLRAKISLSKGGDLLRDVQDGMVPDVFILVPPDEPEAAAASLRIISTLRAHAITRHAGILVLQTSEDSALGAHALDLGADDLMAHGYNTLELTHRIKSLHKRLQMDAQLRATYRTGLNAAILDPLTGLHNRRYAMPHLAQISSHAMATGKPYAVMVADLDHFKQINDDYGHASGDAVLAEVAARLRDALRGSDMVARIGGEEFLIAMPNTTPAEARAAAIRICNDIGAVPFDVPGSRAPVCVTISIGMAIGGDPSDHCHKDSMGTLLLDRADKALYSAKLRGRNRVTFSRPAA